VAAPYLDCSPKRDSCYVTWRMNHERGRPVGCSFPPSSGVMPGSAYRRRTSGTNWRTTACHSSVVFVHLPSSPCACASCVFIRLLRPSCQAHFCWFWPMANAPLTGRQPIGTLCSDILITSCLSLRRIITSRAHPQSSNHTPDLLDRLSQYHTVMRCGCSFRVQSSPCLTIAAILLCLLTSISRGTWEGIRRMYVHISFLHPILQ
jgi:hypothetical protein